MNAKIEDGYAGRLIECVVEDSVVKFDTHGAWNGDYYTCVTSGELKIHYDFRTYKNGGLFYGSKNKLTCWIDLNGAKVPHTLRNFEQPEGWSGISFSEKIPVKAGDRVKVTSNTQMHNLKIKLKLVSSSEQDLPVSTYPAFYEHGSYYRSGSYMHFNIKSDDPYSFNEKLLPKGFFYDFPVTINHVDYLHKSYAGFVKVIGWVDSVSTSEPWDKTTPVWDPKGLFGDPISDWKEVFVDGTKYYCKAEGNLLTIKHKFGTTAPPVMRQCLKLLEIKKDIDFNSLKIYNDINGFITAKVLLVKTPEKKSHCKRIGKGWDK